MKKLLILAAALVSAATSCSKFDSDANAQDPSTNDGVKISIAVAANSTDDATRVNVDGDTWAVTWASSDAILMNNINDNYGNCYKLEMESYDPEVSVFGSGSSYVSVGSYRLIHPYPSTTKWSSTDTYYTFDLSSQKEGLNNTYMVSDQLIAVDTYGVVTGISDYNMQHVGSTIDLNVQMSGTNSEDYVINSVKLCDVPNVAVIDVTKMVSDDDFYYSMTEGDILVTLNEEATIDDSTISNYQFNIFPFERAAGSELTLKFYGVQASTGDNFMITKSFTMGSDLNFARGTYNTINAALSVDNIEMLGDAITVNSVNVGSLMITVDIDINKDVCDGYIYSCSETSDSPVGLAESNYYGYVCQTSGAQPMRAALLGYNTEYFISIVGYKLVDGAISPVGDVYETTVTTSGLAYELTDDVVTATYSDATYTTISAKYERGNAIASFYGCVASDVLADYDSVEDYIDTTGWFSLPANYAHVFYSSSYTSSLTYQICSGVTTFFDSIETSYSSLEMGTEYTMFTIPIGSNGLIGAVETQTISTKALNTDATILPTATVTPASTSASFEFTLENADYVLYRHVSASQSSWTDSDTVYSSFIDGESSYYVTAIRAEDLTGGVYSTSVTGLSIGVENYMYYIGVMEDGTMGEIQCLDYYTVAPTFDAEAGVNYTMASETFSTGWSGNQATVVYDIEMTGDATSYIFYTLTQSTWSPVDVSSAESAANYIIGLSYGNTPSTAATATATLTESSEQYIVIIPITDAGTYGAPIMFQYSWTDDTFDSSASVAISLASSSVESSSYQGSTETIATITMNVELGADAVSYICGIISDVDTSDLDAVGNAVVSLASYNRQDSSDEVTQAFSIYKDSDSYFAIVPVDADGAYGTPVVYEFTDWDGTGTTPPAATEDIVVSENHVVDNGSSAMALVEVALSSNVASYYYAVIDSYVSPEDTDALIAILGQTESVSSGSLALSFSNTQYVAFLPVGANGQANVDGIVIYDYYSVAGTGVAPSTATPSLTYTVNLNEPGMGYANVALDITFGENTAGYMYACLYSAEIPSTETDMILSNIGDLGTFSEDSTLSVYSFTGQYIAIVPTNATGTQFGDVVIYDPFASTDSDSTGGGSSSFEVTSSATAVVTPGSVLSQYEPYNITFSVALEGATSYIYYHYDDYNYYDSDISDTTDLNAVGAVVVSRGTTTTNSSFNASLYSGEIVFVAVVPVDADGAYGTPVVLNFDDIIK